MKCIEFFDAANEIDLQKVERILKEKDIIKNEVVMFPYIMLMWTEERSPQQQ
jgi:hypothetical protein